MTTQQDIINENIIGQLQIRVQQDITKIKKLEEELGRLQKETDLRRELHERVITENQRLNDLLHNNKEAYKKELENWKARYAAREKEVEYWQDAYSRLHKKYEMLVDALAGPIKQGKETVQNDGERPAD